MSTTISKLEIRDRNTLHQLASLYTESSFAKTICFTGPAGVGKSSLIARLAPEVAKTKRLAWLACDPSSPETGGSLLGDRIRLSSHKVPENLFVRSMSTRSSFAFSKAIRDVEVYLENFFDEIWVETAGSGQTQSEVARISSLTVLILQPETGDEVQWMKSGVRDWADLFLVHKSDLSGAELMAQSLMEQGVERDCVLRVSSKTGEGLQEVIEKLQTFKTSMELRARLRILHEWHSKELFLENELLAAEKKFHLIQKKWTRNPYELI